MALNHGKDGGVYDVSIISGAAVTVDRIAETTSWTITTTREFAEIRKHGQEWIKRLGGIRDWSASVEALLDMNTNQTLISERIFSTSKGTMVLALFPSQNAAGPSPSPTLPRWEGTAFVSNISATAPTGDNETITMDFVGHGTLQYIAG